MPDILPPSVDADVGSPTLRPLLALLVDLLGMSIQPADLIAAEAGGTDRPSWTDALAHGGAALGLRMHWVRCTVDEAAALSDPSLPAVGLGPDLGVGPAWVVLSGSRLGTVQMHIPGSPAGPRRLRPSVLQAQWLSPDEVQLWAFVEPSRPASPVLRRTEGQPAPKPLQRLFGLLRAERVDLIAVVVYGVATGILGLAIPLTMQVLINWLAFGTLAQPVIVLTGILLVCLLLAAALRSLQRLAVEMVQRRVFVRMMADLARRLTQVRISTFDTRYGPELVNRFFDVLTVQKAMSSLLVDGLGAALQAAVGLTLLAFYHPALLAYDVVLVLSLVVILFALGKGAEKTAIKESKAKYAAASWIEELARHPLGFKLGGGERFALERADALAQDYLRARDAHWSVFFKQFVGSVGLQAVSSVLLLAVCGWLVLDAELTVGQLVAAEFIVTSALAGFAKFTNKLDSYYDLLAGIDKLGTLVDLPQERETGMAPASRTSPSSVRLDQVVIQQPGGLRRVGPLDLDVPSGARVAVLGGSGSGKSTLSEVILGMRRPHAGQVWRDGIRTEDLRPPAMYRDAMLVRGVDIIQGTVAENVRLNRPEAEIPALREALEQVGLTRTVDALPDGIHTELGPSGTPLSSTQARRLMLARALCARPRLLIIDGALDAMALSGLDPILARLCNPDAPWTLIVFTELPELAARLPVTTNLTAGGLHA